MTANRISVLPHMYYSRGFTFSAGDVAVGIYPGMPRR